MSSTAVLVTGATGFVGGAIVRALEQIPLLSIISCVRGDAHSPARQFDLARPDCLPMLTDIDVVVHCAARVHVMHETAGDALAAFRQANVDATLALARHAQASGVKRFIYLSSIKVNGEVTLPGRKFYADDAPAPQDAYGISKSEAETALLALAAEGGMQVVIIRPPLVYGPGVKANFLAMLRWVRRGVPLPLGAIDNRRSLVYLDNLVDLVRVCLQHPAAANQIFLASDQEPISTSRLLAVIADAMGKRARLLPVPVWMLGWAAGLLGRRGVLQRLTASLQVDIEKNNNLLGWTPPMRTVEGINRTVHYFMSQTRA